LEPQRGGIVVYDHSTRRLRRAFRGVTAGAIATKSGTDDVFLSGILEDGRTTIGTLDLSSSCLRLGAPEIALPANARVAIDPTNGQFFIVTQSGLTTRLERWVASESTTAFFVREAETLAAPTPVSGVAYDPDTSSVVLRSRDTAYVFDGSTLV